MQVALFVTCITDSYYPRVGEAVVRVLRHFGCDVVFPEGQTCCGQPAFNSGFHEHAAAVARRMIDVFAQHETIVTPSASCAAMVREHFPELLQNDPQQVATAQSIAARTHEFTTFLTQTLGVDISQHVRVDEPVTFHYPCHARGVYRLDELQRWLGGPGVADLRVPEHPDLCCGFGGMFAVEYPQISGAMLGDKLTELAGTGAQLVVCNEGGCALNMSGGAHRRGMSLRFKHLAEVLAESLGLMECGT